MNLPIRVWAGSLITMLALSSCLDTENEFEKQIDFEENLLTNYFQQNNIEPTRDNSGIYYQVLQSNPDGTPVEEEDVVSIRYVMRTLDGKLLDSLSAQQQADTVVMFQHIGGALYPQGINLGVRLMNVGEKFRLFIPSYRGYHNFSYKTILPSESILIADVEVVGTESIEDVKQKEHQAIKDYIAEHNLEGVTEQGDRLFYQLLEAGNGNQVKSGEQVEIAYQGYYLNDEVFDESKENQPVKFSVGYSNVIRGLQEGVKLMKEGEKGRIFIPSDLAYGPGTQIVPEIFRNDFIKAMNIGNRMAPFRTLIFEVELKDIN